MKKIRYEVTTSVPVGHNAYNWVNVNLRFGGTHAYLFRVEVPENGSDALLRIVDYLSPHYSVLSPRM
jgi:hypothetical protein